MKKLNKKGFTIVELVIVIAVIAILSAVMIPTFTGLVEKANKSAAIQEADAAYTNDLVLLDGQLSNYNNADYREDVYNKTTDEDVVADTEYYTLEDDNTYAKVESPVKNDIGTYYEKSNESICEGEFTLDADNNLVEYSIEVGEYKVVYDGNKWTAEKQESN